MFFISWKHFYHLNGINISHYIDVFVLGFPLSFYWLSAGKWIREHFNPMQTGILFAAYDQKRGPSEAASPRYNFKTAHDTATTLRRMIYSLFPTFMYTLIDIITQLDVIMKSCGLIYWQNPNFLNFSY